MRGVQVIPVAGRLSHGASQPVELVPWRPGLWKFQLPERMPIVAGVTDRSATLETLQALWGDTRALIGAQQVHGVSVAAIWTPTPAINPVPGCDGLLTHLSSVALIIRSADCLPIFAWDPVHRVIGLAHAGWRGVWRQLPMRLVARMQQIYYSDPHDLWVAIGPAIRACCYVVGEEFRQRFGPFVREVNGRWMCDLLGCVTQQLMRAGVRAGRVMDCGFCTACETTRWHSLRREGDQGRRLLSFITLTS